MIIIFVIIILRMTSLDWRRKKVIKSVVLRYIIVLYHDTNTNLYVLTKLKEEKLKLVIDKDEQKRNFEGLNSEVK